MIKYPFVIFSDIHFNDWSAFSHVRVDKINSRLWETMQAFTEGCRKLVEAGGKDIVITGDIFHTRGKIKPTVFNPVYDLFKQVALDWELNVWALPGNHDLEGKDSDTIGNAFHAFEALPNFTIFDTVSEVGNFVFLPWIEYKDDFIETINAIKDPEEKVVFCHIGIDGVLDKVHGKIGKAVLDRGFKYVFSGDYHNHKALGNGIFSVGALTHHSFSDIGSDAGYLLVTEEGVERFETKAPKFVYGGHKQSCFGNIVRLTGEMTEEEAKKAVKAHYDYGAIHVQDLTTRPTLEETTTSTVPVKVGVNLEEAIDSYVKYRYGANHEAVLKECMRIKNDHVQNR